MDQVTVLVSLYRGYGLGDCVQMSAVLRHLKKYRPHWVIDYQADEGRHCVGRGIVANTFAYGQPYPHNKYDCEAQICLYDTWANWHDRPNTRVSSCLHERFGLAWDRECGRYQVAVSDQAKMIARTLINPNGSGNRNLCGGGRAKATNKVIAFHYRGDSAPAKKNLSHEQAEEIAKLSEKLGHLPLILDWRNELPLSNQYRTVGKTPSSKTWGNDAEINCAVISQCAAFVGIDSGPSKCASSTDTPALVVWTGHHPAPFHDPAPNTTHLVPVGYHGLEPVCDDKGVIEWFERNYNVRMYDGDPVREIGKWLEEATSGELGKPITF